jgi:hypothetical protein
MNACRVGFEGAAKLSAENQTQIDKKRNKKLMLFNGRIKKHDKHNMLFGGL